jgi:hypothetical protein
MNIGMSAIGTCITWRGAAICPELGVDRKWPFLCAHAKAAKVFLDGSAVALRLRCGLLRRAVLERGLCLPRHGTHGLDEASGALPVCRANDPRWRECCHR